MRRFKEARTQATYEWFIINDPDPTTKNRGSAHNAYFVGRYHTNPKKPFAVRGSLAYAAWAAGIDNATPTHSGSHHCRPAGNMPWT